MDNIMLLVDMLSKHLQNVEKKLDNIFICISNGVAPVSAKPVCKFTFFQWLDEWFAIYKAPTLRDGGYDLRHTIDKHVKPNIDDKPLNEYSPSDITKALNAIPFERMRQIVRQIYNQSFREAMHSGYIEHNPVVNVTSISHVYKNGRSLERNEELEFLQSARREKLYPLFAFYLLTGARPSEPLSLLWDDITDDYIRIRGTKTEKSDRTIPLSDNLKSLLSKVTKVSDRVFPYSMGVVRRAFDRVLSRLSFQLTLKDLRHTFGTRCIESGVSMKTVQKWLGHSKFETTANIYSHILTEFEREELSKFSAQNNHVFGTKNNTGV